MRLKIFLSAALILSLLAATSYAAVPTSTSEVALVTSLFRLSGQDLPTQALREQINADLQQYDATAPEQGRIERLTQALVTMKIDTPQQAQIFEAQAQAAASRLVSTNFVSSTDARQALQTELGSLIATSQGAQFSFCDEDGIQYVVLSALFVGGAIWGFQATHGDVLKGALAFIGADSLYVLVSFSLDIQEDNAAGC